MNRALIGIGLISCLLASCGKRDSAAPAANCVARAVLEFKPDPDESVSFQNIMLNQEVLIKTRTLLLTVVEDPRIAKMDFVKNGEDPVKALQDRLETKLVAENQMAVTLQGEPVEEAREVLEVVIEKYLKWHLDQWFVMQDRRKTLLERALADLKVRMSNQKELLEELNQQGRGGATPEEAAEMLKILDSKITETEKELVSERAALAKLKAAKAEINSTVIRVSESKIEEHERQIRRLRDERAKKAKLNELTNLPDNSLNIMKQQIQEIQNKLSEVNAMKQPTDWIVIKEKAAVVEMKGKQ